jgi:tetratricopeptide (TPR) repeat protein
MPADTALDLLEAAVDAAILREVPGRARFRFVHALVQHTLYDDLSQTRRRRLHRAAAEAAERLESASTSAAHWLAAEDLADALRAVAACTAAADEALLARAPDEAAGWYAAALDRLGLDDDPPVHCELMLRLGEAQRLAGDPRHRATLVEASALARRLGDPERLARAALANTRWFSSSVGTENTAQIDLLEAALEAVGPEPSGTRARLLATLVAELVYSDRPFDRFAVAEEALQIARAVGDQDALFEVLFWRNTVAKTTQADSGRDDAEVEELIRIADAGTDPLRQGMADLVFVLRMLENGTPGRADAAMARATQVAEELRLPVLRWLVTVMRGTLAALSGHVADAEKLAFEAFEQSQATDQPDAITWFGVQLYMIRYEQGRLTELVDMAHARIAKSPKLYTWHASLAMSLTELDRFDEARAVVRQMLDVGYPTRKGEPHWIIGMACLGSAVAALGDPADAAAVYTALLPSAGRWASIMPLSLGSVDRVLGELATTIGRLDDAEGHFSAAIAAHDAAPTPGYAARSRLGLMRVLMLRDPKGNADAVADLAGQVRVLTERYELPRVATLLATFDAPVSAT